MRGEIVLARKSGRGSDGRFNHTSLPTQAHSPNSGKRARAAMGVHDLLPMLKSVMDQVNIAKYRGKTVGIDAAGWLYKGCYSCAKDVVLGKATDAYLNFPLQQIELLHENGVRPIFVFDGAPLPAKAELNATRNRTRYMWRQKLVRGEANGEESNIAFNRAVSVSNEMIMKFIAVLKRMNIEFIVAPYEADAQLAYLSKIKVVDAVVSEDSDCIPYGCRTMLFKWNEGWASELKRRRLGANEDLSFAGWSEEMFIQFCVLCGCDYCPSVSGVGVVSAYKLVNVHKKPRRVIEALERQKGDLVPRNYSEQFFTALLTYRHHLVFDPRDQKLKMLNPLAMSGDIIKLVDEELRFLGNIELKDEVVSSVANASIHPVTHESYEWGEAIELRSVWKLDDSNRSMTSSETDSNHGNYAHPEQPVVSSNGDCEDEVNRGGLSSTGSTKTKEPLMSWRHLDGVLGSSSHILNFRSPKVSENFKSLISTDSQRPQFRAGKTADELKAFENVPCRQSLKRVRNPRNRKREDQKSGFEGEVSCRVDVNDALRSTQRRRLEDDFAGSTTYESKAQEQAVTNCDDAVPAASVANSSSLLRFAFTSEELKSPGLHGDETSQDQICAPRAFNAVTARRAVTAEEKWDQILQPELSESEHEDTYTNALTP